MDLLQNSALSPTLPVSYDGSRPYCFISYSSRDKETVHTIVKQLMARGFNVWIDLELEKHIGEQWDKIACEAILNQNCQCLLWFVSANSCQSPNVAKELEFSGNDRVRYSHSGRTLPIFPLEIDAITPNNNIITFCENLKAQDIPDENKAAVDRVLDVVQDNRLTRLSVTKVFSDEGQNDLAESMKNADCGDVVKNPVFRQYESYLQRITQQSSTSHNGLLTQADPDLLPKFCANDESRTCDIDELIERATTQKNGDFRLMLFGNGGTGKTTALLYIMQRLAEKGLAAMYIPLNEIGQDTTILDYAKHQLYPHTNDRPPYLDSFLTSKSVVYLLDGLNEVAPQNETAVARQIKALTQPPATLNTIITTRYIDSSKPKYKDICAACEQYDIIPLSKADIRSYLDAHGVQLPQSSSKLIEILSSPLMLKLYINQQDFQKGSYRELDDLWMEQSNESSLIFNYLLLECAKLCSNGNTDKRQVFVSLFYLAPYLAWSMVSRHTMSLTTFMRDEALNNAHDFYNQACAKIRDNDATVDAGFFQSRLYLADYEDPRYDHTPLFAVLLDSGLMLHHANGTYSFFHQSFRDCLAALHCLNAMRLTPMQDVATFSKHILGEDILRYINGLDDQGTIDLYWRNFDHRIRPAENSSTLMNLILLLRIKNNGMLNTVNFARKDLRNISLNAFSFTNGVHSAKFRNAKISAQTFAPPVTHNDIITCFAVSEDFKYIISGDNTGMLIVYDTEQAQPVDSLNLAGRRVAVKELFVFKSYLYVCYLNGHVFRIDFSEGTLKKDQRHFAPPEEGTVPDICRIDEKLYLILNAKLFQLSPDAPQPWCELCDFADVDAIPTCLAAALTQTDYIYCGLSNGEIMKFDLLGDELLPCFEAKHGPGDILALAVHEDYLYSVGNDRKVLCWDTYDEALLDFRWDTTNGRMVDKLCVSPDGKYLITASTDGNLIRVKAATADGLRATNPKERSGAVEHHYKFSATKGRIHGICISADGKYLVCDTTDNTPTIHGVWEKTTPYRDFYSNISGAVVAISVSSNGKWAISQSKLGHGIECVAWDLENQKPYHCPIRLASLWGKKSKTISDDGKLLYIGQGERISFVNLNDCQSSPTTALLERFKGWMYSIFLDENTQTVWIGSDDKLIYRLNMQDASLKDVSEPMDATINCFCATESAEHVYAGDWNGSIYKLDQDMRVLSKLACPDYHGWVSDVCVSSDEAFVFAALANGQIVKMDRDLSKVITTWQYKGTRRWDKPDIVSLTVDRNAQKIIALSNDNCAFVLNESTLELEKAIALRQKFGEESAVRAATQIKGSGKIIVGDNAGDMHLFDMLDETTSHYYHKIKNVCLVGCDFTGADLGADEALREELKGSGAIV